MIFVFVMRRDLTESSQPIMDWASSQLANDKTVACQYFHDKSYKFDKCQFCHRLKGFSGLLVLPFSLLYSGFRQGRQPDVLVCRMN